MPPLIVLGWPCFVPGLRRLLLLLRLLLVFFGLLLRRGFVLGLLLRERPFEALETDRDDRLFRHGFRLGAGRLLHRFFPSLPSGGGDDDAARHVEELVVHHALAEVAVGPRELLVLQHADGPQVALGGLREGLEAHLAGALGPLGPDHGHSADAGVVQELARLVVARLVTALDLVVGLGTCRLHLAVLAEDGEHYCPRLLLLPAVEKAVHVEGQVPHVVPDEAHATGEPFAELLLGTVQEPAHEVKDTVRLAFLRILEVGVDEDAELAGVEGGLLVGHCGLRISN